MGKLREQAAATGAELNSKFSGEQGTFELAFGSTDTFYGGLEVTPAPRSPPPIPRSSPLAHPRLDSQRHLSLAHLLVNFDTNSPRYPR